MHFYGGSTFALITDTANLLFVNLHLSSRSLKIRRD